MLLLFLEPVAEGIEPIYPSSQSRDHMPMPTAVKWIPCYGNQPGLCVINKDILCQA